MKKIIHRAWERGFADHGWLKAAHSFSFASWYNKDKVNFGALRVLNDDEVAPGKGFGTHPHDNMEIITIPLEGNLQHRDSMGNGSIIRPGEIQYMSAGTGVQHSEFNPSHDEKTRLLQIWIFPSQRDLEPRYAQLEYKAEDLINRVKILLAPHPQPGTISINQKAWISLARPLKGFELEYEITGKENGLYLFVIEGEIITEGETLKIRDAIGFSEIRRIRLKAGSDSFLLFLDVPMQY